MQTLQVLKTFHLQRLALPHFILVFSENNRNVVQNIEKCMASTDLFWLVAERSRWCFLAILFVLLRMFHAIETAVSWATDPSLREVSYWKITKVWVLTTKKIQICYCERRCFDFFTLQRWIKQSLHSHEVWLRKPIPAHPGRSSPCSLC